MLERHPGEKVDKWFFKTPTGGADSVAQDPKGDTLVAAAIVAKESETFNQTPINVGMHSGDFANTVAATDDIVGGGKMSFLDRDGETTSELATLIGEAVSGTPLSLLSGMLTTMPSPEAATPPHFRSEAVPLPTTLATTASLIQSATSSSMHSDALRATFERGGSIVVESRPFSTVARDTGHALLIFLKSAIRGIQTVKSEMAIVSWKRAALRTTRPLLWSAGPKAFVHYDNLHGQQVSEIKSDSGKRHHFPDTETIPLP